MDDSTSRYSGEVRRHRIREFHQNKSRSPGFYTKQVSSGIANQGGPGAGETPDPRWRNVETIPGFNRNGGRFPWWQALLFVVLGALLAGLVLLPGGYFLGKKMANREAAARMRTVSRLSKEDAAKLESALAELRAGHSFESLASLKAIKQKAPQAASLNYLAALAALQAGSYRTAEDFAQDSIRVGQRVSDSFTLLSIIEKGKGASAGDEKKVEELLRVAITADAANPYPHFELAQFLREKGRIEEARQEMRAAQARLAPVDGHAAISASLALMDLEGKADAELPESHEYASDLTGRLSAAYAALRRSDFPLAAESLRTAKTLCDPDVYLYLISDPAFRRYSTRPELAQARQ